MGQWALRKNHNVRENERSKPDKQQHFRERLIFDVMGSEAPSLASDNWKRKYKEKTKIPS